MQILVFLLTFSLTTPNESNPVRDTVIIDSVPFIEWTYGCVPTATAMILWYWDYRNYGRLVDFFFDFYDSVSSNRPNVIKELNETSLIYVTDTLNGYNFQSQTSPQGGQWNQWQFSWIKDEIDNGRPCLWAVFNYWWGGQYINHMCCAVGYIIAPPDTFVIVHNTWHQVEVAWPLWTYHSGVYSNDYVITVEPGGANPDNIFITFPTEAGVVFQYGDTVDITWDSYGSEIDYIKIWYANASTYDSLEWTLIDSCAPNTGVYTWIVPEESLCARINLQAFNIMDSLEAADGSFYSFMIVPTGIAEQEINTKNIFFNVSPNIFTDHLTIEFSALPATPISLETYDVAGRLVKTLSCSAPYALCPTLITWDGRDNKGQKLGSGIYFISLKQENKIKTKKVIYLPH